MTRILLGTLCIAMAGPLLAVEPKLAPSKSKSQSAVPAEMQAFTGRWNGKWSNSYEVHFTAAPSFFPNSMVVQYQWQERTGEPLREFWDFCKVTDSAMKVGTKIELTLDPEKSTRATAKGDFPRPRVAELAWSPVPSNFLNPRMLLDKKLSQTKPLTDESLEAVLWQVFYQTGAFTRIDDKTFPSKEKYQQMLGRKLTYELRRDASVREVLNELLTPHGMAFEPQDRWVRVYFKGNGPASAK